MTEGPPMRHMTLDVDELDYQAIQKAIAERQTWRDEYGATMPDGNGNMAGRVLAEICRGWTER